ncbi:unnamed protein product [Sphagnum tenellum]
MEQMLMNLNLIVDFLYMSRIFTKLLQIQIKTNGFHAFIYLVIAFLVQWNYIITPEQVGISEVYKSY